MTTQNSAMGDKELHTKLDDMLSNFLHDYRQGYDNSKEQGLNLEYCTFDSVVSFLDGIKEIIKSRDQQIALVARKDQTFKVIQSLVKSHLISDSAASQTLLIQNAKIDAEQAQNKEK